MDEAECCVFGTKKIYQLSVTRTFTASLRGCDRSGLEMTKINKEAESELTLVFQSRAGVL